MKSFLSRLFFISLVALPFISYAQDGSNYVNVYSCRNVEKGIMIVREAKDSESFLSNGVRDAGHGLRDYSLKCVAQDRYYVEWKEASTALTQTQPDLLPLSVSFDPSTRIPTLTIKNQGTAGTTTLVYGFEIQWLDQNQSQAIIMGRSYRLEALAANASQNMTLEIPPFAFLPQTKYLRIRMDHTNAVSESNEENNVITVAFPESSMTSGLPDLVVNIDKIDRTSIVYAAQPATWITYTVTNKGNASTNAPIFLHPVSNGSSANMGYMKIDPLASGASITKAFAVGHDSLWPAGKYVVKLEADYDNVIAESNENNNSSNEQAFTVIDSSTSTTLTSSCESPYVEYQGKCVDPVPACENPPANYMPSSCVDKIENGKRIPRYNFQCMEGYTRAGSECVKSATAPKMSCGNSGGGSGLYSGCVGDTLSYHEGQVKALVEILAYDQSSVTVAIKKPDGSGSGTVLAKQAIQMGTSYKYGLGTDTDTLADDAILVVTYKQVTDKHGAFIHVTANQPAVAAADTSCAAPYVLYQGKCADPIPACRNGIKNSISCIDKIENGKYTEHFYYSCLPGYEKRNDQCIGGSETNARPVTKPTAVRVPTSPALDTGVSVGYEDEVVTAKAKNPFSDTDMNTLVGQAAVGLHALGIIGGYADGTFKGNRPVNRAEAAKFLLLSRYSSSALQDIRNEGKFWDVLDGQWYTRFIMNAYAKGFMNGYGDGSMGPGKNVNTAEFLKMLALNFALPLNLSYSYADVSGDAWFVPYAGIAAKYNLFPERKGKLYPANELTRAEVAIALYQYLRQK